MTSSSMFQAAERQIRRERGLVHLQFVGDLPGTPSAELKTGDHLMWNGGAVYVITGIREASPKFVEITERAARCRYSPDPKPDEYTRRLKRDRLVVRLTDEQVRQVTR